MNGPGADQDAEMTRAGRAVGEAVRRSTAHRSMGRLSCRTTPYSLLRMYSSLSIGQSNFPVRLWSRYSDGLLNQIIMLK